VRAGECGGSARYFKQPFPICPHRGGFDALASGGRCGKNACRHRSASYGELKKIKQGLFMMISKSGLMAGLFCALYLPLVSAATIEVRLEGVVDALDYEAPVDAVLTPGAQWSSVFYIDTEARDWDDSARLYFSNNPPGRFRIAGKDIALGFRGEAGGTNMIVGDYTNATAVVFGGIIENDPPEIIDGVRLGGYYFSLFSNAHMLAGTQVTAESLLDLQFSDFDIGGHMEIMSYENYRQNEIFRGTITGFSATVVPLPGALIYFLSGLAPLFVQRVRRLAVAGLGR